MKKIQEALTHWSSADIRTFESEGKATVEGFTLVPEDVQIVRKAKEGRSALAQFGLVSELDTQLTDELVVEGLRREIINRIQQKRKELKLHLSDRIVVRWHAQAGSHLAHILDAETTTEGSIRRETLARDFKFVANWTGAAAEDFGPDGTFAFEVERVG